MITEYNPAFNDYIRIPLQLKFERDDMFETLIAPARADRSLTTLIQQLLQAYYTSQTVRDIVAQQSMGFSDIDLLAKQVDKVAKAHNTTRMLAGMMADDIQDANDGLYAARTPESDVNSSKGTVAGAGSDAVMAMLQEIAAQVGNLSTRMNQMESTQQANAYVPVQTQAQPQAQAPRQAVVQPIDVSVAAAVPQANAVNSNVSVTKTTAAKPTASPTNSFAKLASSMANLG